MSNYLEDAYFTQQPIAVLATYDSTSATSGALLTEGGLGVKLSAHIGEQLTVNSVNVTPSLGDIVHERQRELTPNTYNATVGEFYFFNDITQSFKAVVSVHVNDTVDKNAIFTLHGTLKNGSWSLNSSFTGDVTGVKFSINDTSMGDREAGEILYSNTNSVGTTTTIRFKANTLSPTGASNDAATYASVPATLNANSIVYNAVNPNNWESTQDTVKDAIDELSGRLSNIRFQYEYYVSKDGNNDTGNGSLEKPYLTVSAALLAANSHLNVPVVINISPGQYTENLTITKPNIGLRATIAGSTKTTRINGSVTISPSNADGGVYSNYYTFENLSIVPLSGSSHVLAYTGNYTGYLYLRDCMLYAGSPGIKGLVFTNTTSMKVNISKTEINVGGTGDSNAIYSSAGSDVNGSFYNCNIYGKTAPTISIDGSSNIAFNYSYIDNTGNDVVELKNIVVAYFSYCTIANSKLNSNGFNISNATSLILSQCIINIPSNGLYPGSGTPPATTGYAVKGFSTSNVVYGGCLFAPVSVVNGTYYWGTRAISNVITPVSYLTSFLPQAN